MKICVVCTEWTRAALTAAAQVRAQADKVRAQGDEMDRKIADEQRRMCDELRAQSNVYGSAAALGIRKGE